VRNSSRFSSVFSRFSSKAEADKDFPLSNQDFGGNDSATR
jgi:hypothetical protein